MGKTKLLSVILQKFNKYLGTCLNTEYVIWRLRREFSVTCNVWG